MSIFAHKQCEAKTSLLTKKEIEQPFERDIARMAAR